MGLKVTSQEQASKVLTLYHGNILDEDIETGLAIDGFITFDEMAEIVDYLRTQAPKKELFEECWVAYKRKGSKKKSLEYWKKLTDVEKENVLAHIKAYVSSRELQYQKDFERYLRDKTFQTIVYQGNVIVYDPTKLGKGETINDVYMPSGNFAITWDDNLKAYLYIGFYSDGMMMPDGYDNDNRPDGAKLVLNNGRGTITWNKTTKTWNRV